MRTISLLLIVTIAAMGCATTPRPSVSEPRSWTDPIEPVAQAPDTATDTPPPPGMSTGQIVGTIALVVLLVPVAVLLLAYSGSRGSHGYGGWYGKSTYTTTTQHSNGRVSTSTTTVRSSRR
jgi:hypothetical protein